MNRYEAYFARSYVIKRGFALQQGRRLLYEGVHSSHTRPECKTKYGAGGGKNTIYEMTSTLGDYTSRKLLRNENSRMVNANRGFFFFQL